MARTRSAPVLRLNREAKRLVTFAQALNRSGSRAEDTYWERQLAEVIVKLLRPGKDTPLETALDYLAEDDTGAYEALIEQAETLSESFKIEKDGIRYDALLVVAPIVAWTRYAIPSGSIPTAAHKDLLAKLQKNILADAAQVVLMPRLVSVDQMPRSFAQTYQWMQLLAEQTTKQKPSYPSLNSDETIPMLADTRYLVALVTVTEHAPFFRWQAAPDDATATRDACLAAWTNEAMPILTPLLAGCGLECLLPDAYYVSNRAADRQVRPLALRAAISWLESAVSLPAEQLRATIVACGQTRAEEYRIGFSARNSNDVYYGCVWPIYGREEEIPIDDETQLDTVDLIAALLKEYGINEVRRIPGIVTPEFCDDCEAPYFPDPLGQLVHTELPEDAQIEPAKFH